MPGLSICAIHQNGEPCPDVLLEIIPEKSKLPAGRIASRSADWSVYDCGSRLIGPPKC